jgi:hypothetical protein
MKTLYPYYRSVEENIGQHMIHPFFFNKKNYKKNKNGKQVL